MEDKTTKVCAIINHLLDGITFVLITCLLIYSTYCLLDNYFISKKADASIFEPYKPTENNTKTFDDFISNNSDVVGWLTINNTAIDYPLVQGDDNSFYVTHDAMKDPSLSGSLFLDHQNNKDFTDTNTIIYGHHMEKSKMFGSIDSFLDEAYFMSHQTASVYYQSNTVWSWHQCSVVAILSCNANDTGLYTPNCDLQTFLTTVKDTSIHSTEFNTTGNYIECSTCQDQTTDGRLILLLQIDS